MQAHEHLCACLHERRELWAAKINYTNHVFYSAREKLDVWTEVAAQSNFPCRPLEPGADHLEHATPILSLCHGIFTDWSIFSIPFPNKGSSASVTQWRQLVSCDWLRHSHGSLIFVSVCPFPMRLNIFYSELRPLLKNLRFRMLRCFMGCSNA